MNDLAVLHYMTLFVEVARTHSFSRASANLGVPGATLSRRIAAMERRFGVRLFDRTTRRVEPTDAGRRYFERCGDLVDLVEHECITLPAPKREARWHPQVARQRGIQGTRSRGPAWVGGFLAAPLHCESSGRKCRQPSGEACNRVSTTRSAAGISSLIACVNVPRWP